MELSSKDSETNESANAKQRQAPLFWTRMLRFSIYYTIMGIGLTLIYFIRATRPSSTEDSASAHGADVDHLVHIFDVYPKTLAWALLFILTGLISIIVCCVLRSKEKRLRSNIK